ncbi:MAG: PLDc_N domain-containing protein, partial [Clostridia bacterium]|nr:PLDc_N domain-containing protein [Clostridia bacterium]
MKKFLHSGIISFTVILIIQIGVIASLIFWLNEYREYILGVTTLISVILLVYEINRPSEPAFKYAWIVLITVLPVFGWLLYIYTHLNVVTNKISKKTESIEEETDQHLVQDTEVLKEIAETEILGISKYLGNVAKCPTYKNT